MIMSLPAQRPLGSKRQIQPGSSLESAHNFASTTRARQQSFRTAGPSETPFSLSPPVNGVTLGQDDLLGSFDDLDASKAEGLPWRRRGASVEYDAVLQGEDFWKEPQSANHSQVQDPSKSTSYTEELEAMHINLPPRPSEISPDYAPPLSPRRSSQIFSSLGTGPQPLVPDAGRDIIFHTSFDSQSNKQVAKVDRSPSIQHASDGHNKELTVFGSESPSHHGSAQSILFNTFANTTKLAAKWKHVLESSAIPPPGMQTQPHQPIQGHHPLFSGPIAQAIDITHVSPFASAQQLAGSYIPPTGAPAFDLNSPIAVIHAGHSDDFSGTRLLGRRDETVKVLLHKDADRVGATR